MTVRRSSETVEYLDIVDILTGEPTGETVERSRAHLEGIPHRTAHVWIYRRHCGRIQLLLQKRCAAKDSFPGCYDVSSAGHIPAGTDYITSALRELKEELGVEAQAEELTLCGSRRIIFDTVFHERPFHDRQYTRVFALCREGDEISFVPQPEEIESVMWIDYEECIGKVHDLDFQNCLDTDDLKMIGEKIL